MPPRLSNSAQKAKRPNIEGVTSHLQGAEVEVWLEPVGVAAPDHVELPLCHAHP
jgi:hypothetical protein